MRTRQTTAFALAVGLLFIGTFALLVACTPTTISDSWRLVTVENGEAYLCTSDSVLDSAPPRCPAPVGTELHRPLGGALVDELVDELGNRHEAIVTATLINDVWMLEHYEL